MLLRQRWDLLKQAANVAFNSALPRFRGWSQHPNKPTSAGCSLTTLSRAPMTFGLEGVLVERDGQRIDVNDTTEKNSSEGIAEGMNRPDFTGGRSVWSVGGT